LYVVGGGGGSSSSMIQINFLQFYWQHCLCMWRWNCSSV